jgi:iron(III) transport system ATP-binding protein
VSAGPVNVKAVSKRFAKRPAVEDVSFEVAPGGTLGIIGPSGCGKTTILRLIAGLEVPDKGEIWLDGQLASSAGRLHVAPARRNIGFVFQDLALWPHLTVAGNLLFVLESRRWPVKTRAMRVRQMLDLVGLAERIDEYPGHLSGGEQQRVGLARALVSEPDLLLLDEPLASLDHDRRSSLRQEIVALQRQLGVTMIYVTHDRADADGLGGYVLRMSANSSARTQRR